jgi:lantibiotic biosynthesis protein
MSQQMEMIRPALLAPSIHRDAFIETAAAIGAKVCRDALWANDRCNWIGPVMEPLGGRWRQVHKVFGPELYLGTSGVALSLATLYQSTGDRVFRKTAIAAMRHALGRADDIEPFSRMGLYSGWLGIVLAGLNIAKLLDQHSLRDASLRLVDELISGHAETTNADVLAGFAGAVVALVILREQFLENDKLVETATALADDLIHTAIKTEAGWSWGELYKPESGAFGNLAGYSHGVGGIGWALLELYHATGETRFREAGEAAFQYERHWFDPETGNWPDLRDPTLSGAPRSSTPSFMNAWCHGAPGIALSRLRSYEILQCATCLREAETAIDTTLKNLYGNVEMSQTNYSLCHGLGGNAEPLIYGAKVLGRPELFARAEEVALRGIETYEAKRLPWPCGGPGGLETAGLMLGLAGISYFYLRMAAPELTPSVLIFSPQVCD